MNQFRMLQFRLPAAAVVIAMLSLAASVAKADDKNEVIKHWAKFKPGSSVTMSADIAAGGVTVAMKKTEKLVEVTADHVTLETVVTTNFGGQERANPPQRTTIDSASNQGTWKEVGKGKIEAGGKTFDCRIMEGSAPAQALPDRGGAKQTDAKAQIWVNEEIPGGVVQIKVNTAGHEMTFKLVSFEAK